MMRRLLVISFAVVTPIVIGCAQDQRDQGSAAAVRHPARTHAAEFHIAVILYPGGANACAGTLTPSYLPVQTKDTVIFDIVNLCDAGQTTEQAITVAAFTGDAGNQDPMDQKSGSDKKQIKFVVRSDATPDVYKYTVTRGAMTIVDPEIDVER